jgi:hypothetical protein
MSQSVADSEIDSAYEQMWPMHHVYDNTFSSLFP